MPRVVWSPQPGSQTLFVTSPIYETLYEGTRGPGKTNGLLIDFCQHVGQGYGAAWRGILFRQHYPDLADVVAKSKDFIPKAFPDADFLSSGPDGYTWRFATGETLLFRHMATRDDYTKYHGHEYPWIAWEELTMWPSADCYEIMKSCCRSSSPARPPLKYRSTTNSRGAGHHWVKSRFIDPAPVGTVITDERGNQRIAIHGHWSENRFLMDNDPQYVERLLAATEDDPDLQAAWVDGSWEITSGTFFGSVWNKRTHVVRPFVVPLHWRIDRAFDWGSSKPFSVGWWTESDGTGLLTRTDGTTFSVPRGTLIRVGEWYGCDPQKPNVGLKLDAKAIAAGILERERRMWPGRLIAPGPADSSIFDVQDGHCIAASFAQAGVTWERANKGPGSRKNGAALLRDRLKAAKSAPVEQPALYVFETCRDFIRTIPQLPRSEKDPDDIDTAAEDHIYDEARYRALAPLPAMVTFTRYAA